MKKNKSKDNTLIKRKNLVLILKKAGVKRAAPGSVLQLENYFNAEAEKIADMLKEELRTHGRKTLMKEDVRNVLRKLKKEENPLEI